MPLIHFKCTYDPQVKWEEVCERMFSGRYLCVLEKQDSNPHVHIQGETDYQRSQIENIQRELINAVHWKRKQNPKCQLCRNSSKEVTEMGYQYMCKEGDNVLFARGFTDQEIEQLHEQSEQYVEELKSGYKRKLDEIEYSGRPEKYHRTLATEFCMYYRSEKKQTPPGTPAIILNYMLQKDPLPDELRDYVVEKICKL